MSDILTKDCFNADFVIQLFIKHTLYIKHPEK